LAHRVVGNAGSAIRDDETLVTALAWFTIAGIVAYVLLTVIAQFLPPHYSPIHDAESDLAVGPYGYLMTIAFVVRGIISVALLIALDRALPARARSKIGMILFGIWGAGALLLSMFPADVVKGRHTVHGDVHLVVALVAFVCGAVGEVLLSRRMSVAPWSRASRQVVRILSYFTATTLVLFFFLTPRPRVFGLFERLFIGAALVWMLVTAAVLVTQHSRGAEAQPNAPA